MNRYVLLLCLCLLLVVVFSTMYFKMVADDNNTHATTGDLRSEVYAYQGDFEEHYYHASTLDNSTYPPLLAWIAHSFSSSRTSFYYFVSIIIFLLVPLILYFLTKNGWIAFFYFATSLAFQSDYLAIYPQLLVSVWLIAFLLINDWRFRLISLFTVGLLHSWGFPLFLLTWIVIELHEIVLTKIRVWLADAKRLGWGSLLGCVPLGGGLLEKTNFVKLIDIPWLPQAKSTITQVSDLFRFFSRDCNLIFVFCAIKGFVDKKRLDFIIIGIVLFVAGCFEFRVWYSMFLLVVVGFTWFFEELSFKWKIPFVLLGIIFIVLHLVTWFFDKKLLIIGSC